MSSMDRQPIDRQPIDRLDRQTLQQQAFTLGFHKVGIARVADWQSDPATDRSAAVRSNSALTPQSTVRHLQNWLAQGYQADMAWMANPKRQDIRSLMPSVRSVICLALNYYAPDQRPEGSEYAKISRYGWGRDYHRILHKKLKAFALWLAAQQPGIETRYYADTGPIQDKVWAERAGLGWIAKNSNLITREYGSWIFLGEVLINLDLEPDRPHTQHCGTCTRCLDACPTQAITQPFVVDANRCIAYHTIENRAPELPPEIAANLQGWVAGCDICQDVCPWNQRFAQPTDVTEFHPYAWNVAPTLGELATLSDQDWDRRFPASALRRIKPEMLRRNAQANLNHPDRLA